MSINRKFNDNNPYISPEACGFKLTKLLDRSTGCYEFDYLIVWQDLATERFYYATDSGCSCPCPFENVSCLAELIEIKDIDEAEKAFYSWFKGPYSWDDGKDGCCDTSDIEALVDYIKKAMKGESNESLAK